MAISVSSSHFFLRNPPILSSLPSVSSLIGLKGWGRTVLVRPVQCLPSGPTPDSESEAERGSSSFSSSSSTSISAYKWCAGLGSVGLLETAYLTFLKLTNTDAFCPIAGAGEGCGGVLNSEYAIVFGVPLPLIGMVAYGLVATLGLQLAGKNTPFGISESDTRLILLGSTTSMAVASGYFLYILSTKFPGASCLYCIMSALLSFSLFFITLKDFGLREMQKSVGLQLLVASLVVITLSASYSTAQPVSSSQAEVELQFFKTEITTPSSPFGLSLARHLRSVGAKMYGAFWCSHCLEQKQMFGREASELLDYVECFPDGYRKGTKIEKACADARIEGFPTWVINGQVLSGEQELSDLAEASGFTNTDSIQPS
ncbi:thiol-disulfide oxidoreductase LTO1 isoform X2 [Tripterygium wilfordii]|uniref:thiol-disulfide oxidoreductase LTO1 isoform X2 n=1 Tax=Tripterygium wilfordii TaxID=458696 RepID=UPI0018F83557|nr:thiol-disulfide oxidoreductase LTO1 isoform X2 [Tripterygium wilfordii]